MVVVHAGTDMDWNPAMLASFGAHFGIPVEEGLLALVGRIVGLGAGGAEVVVRDDFQDIGRAKFANSTVAAEWVMGRLEVLDSTHDARTTRRRRINGRGMRRWFGFVAEFYRANGFDAHIC